MYADRSLLSPARTLNLGAALAVTGGIVAGMTFFLAPQLVFAPPREPFIGYPVPLPKDPPPDKPKPETAQPRPSHVDTTPTPPRIPVETPFTTTIQPPFVPTAPMDAGTGTGDVAADPPKPAPPLIGAMRDPRFARDFQPQYPGAELRMQREGTATVRVHIGPDGRVTEVQQVRATSPGFFEATKRQALAKWRFRPATRGGVPEDSWQTLTVTFVLTGA